jgi:hypothetical protein
MGTIAKQGSFTLNTSTGNQSITGLGFTPKLVIFWSLQVASVGGGDELHRFFGASTGGSNQWVTLTSVNPFNNYHSRQLLTSSCIRYNDAASDSPVCEASFVSMDTIGFTINVKTGANVPIYYLAVGGASFSAYASFFDVPTTAQGTMTSVTGVGFTPKAIIFNFSSQNASGLITQASYESASGGDGLNIGFTDGTNSESVSQWYDPVNSVTVTAGYTGYCVLGYGYNADGFDHKAHIQSMDSNGFTLYWDIKYSGSTLRLPYIALGGTSNFKVGAVVDPGITGNQTYTISGIKPVAELFLSPGISDSLGTINSTSRLDIGVAVNSTQRTTSSMCIPSSSYSGSAVTEVFFGMHLAAETLNPWPTVTFKTRRLWDSYPGISWSDINTSNGVYNWAALDAEVNGSISHGVTEIIYTFGYLPSWVNASNTANPDDTSWTNFVTAIVNRYKTQIKYWELWNEPNASNFWTGTTAQMVHLASIAAPIIRAAGCTVLSPSPQGTNAHLWLNGYWAAGGGSYTDIVSFHGYLIDAPEKIITLVGNIKSGITAAGLPTKPIWDTEHSWLDTSSPFGATTAQQSAWLARFITLEWCLGIDRSCWYMWDNFTYGVLYDRTSNVILPPGIAYRELRGWIVGSTVGQYTISTGNLYTVPVTHSNGAGGFIVWCGSTTVTDTVSYTIPTGCTSKKSLDGTSTTVTPGTTITVGMQPILVESLTVGTGTISGSTLTTAALGRYDSVGSTPNWTVQADFISQNSNGFTLNWTQSGGASCRFPYLVFAEPPAAVSRMMIGVFN